MNRQVQGVDLVMVVGGLAMFGAVAIVAVPSLVPTSVVALFAPVANGAVVGLLALVAAGLGLRTVYRGRSRSHDPAVSLPATPAERERRREGEVRTAGRDVDDLLAVIEGDKNRNRVDRLINQSQVRDAARKTAVAVLADAKGHDHREALDRINRGNWTDRPRAAAFLGDEAPDPPLEVRIRDWLSGETFERRVRVTVDELADVAGVETGSGVVPEPLQSSDEGGVRSPVGYREPEEAGDLPTADAREADREEGDGDVDPDPDAWLDDSADVAYGYGGGATTDAGRVLDVEEEPDGVDGTAAEAEPSTATEGSR